MKHTNCTHHNGECEEEQICLPYGGKMPPHIACHVQGGSPVCLSAENPLEKIDVINALNHRAIAYDADGEICFYVIVPLDKETVDVLTKLGATNADIMHNARWDKDNKQLVIDLTVFGFEFANWWSSESGFCLKEID